MSTMQGSTAAGQGGSGGKRTAGAFDIRTFIASLIGIYGIVLVLMAIFATSTRDMRRDGNINVNLWAGIGMIIVAAVLVTWARLRPLVVAPEGADDADPAARGVENTDDEISPDAGRV
jgi:hypothetical protein